MFQSVARGYTFDFLRKEAETLLRDLGTYAARFDEAPPPNTDRWVAALYRGDPDSLPVVRARFEELAPRWIAARFYLGECDLLAGDFESARRHFNDVITVEAPAWEHAYQMIAATRIAEIYAHGGFYKTAARYQAVALTYYHNEYLLDWVLEGRKKYFERLSQGEESRPPTLLTVNAGRATRLPNGGGSASTRHPDDE
jgi:tetratricopeptide (TPR) repeat protein